MYSGVVAGRGRVPDLPALVPGLRRRRDRRPARDRARGWTIWRRSASTRSGSRRCTPRRLPTAATTSPTSPASTRAWAAWTTWSSWRRRRTAGGCGCCSTSCPTTPRSSTRGSASTRTGTCGRTRRRTTGGRRSAARPGRGDARNGRAYLHSFYPEQPDLDWRNPAVAAAMQEVVRTWLARGVDGFRVDAIDRLGKHPDLLDDPPATGPPAVSRAARRGRARAPPLAQLRRPRCAPRSPPCARRPATRSWSARCTGRPRASRPTWRTSRARSCSSSCSRSGGPRRRRRA